MKLLTKTKNLMHLCMFLSLTLVFSLSACDDDDNGQGVKTASSVYVKGYSGEGQVKLVWGQGENSTAVKTIIRWNNRESSMTKEFVRTQQGEVQEESVEISLPEGSYIFELTHYDKNDISSDVQRIAANSYGDEYLSKLPNRPVLRVKYNDDMTASLIWDTKSENTSIVSTTVTYKSASTQTEKSIVVESEEEVTELPDIAKGETVKIQSSHVLPNVIGTLKANIATLPSYLNIIAMQYNARIQTASDKDNNWPNRKETAAQFMKDKNVEIIGLQELSTSYKQYDSLMELLGTDYEGYEDKRGGFPNEALAIIYKKDKFTLAESGKFWLSETPDVAGKGWDASYNRISVWTILKENRTGQEIFVMSTHFDNTGVTARNNSATLTLEKIKELSGGRPVILMGDLNTNPNTVPTQTLTTELAYTRDVAFETAGPNYTINSFSDSPTPNVFFDYVFVSKSIDKVYSDVIAESKYNGIFLSDHNAVIVDMDILLNIEEQE